MGIKSSIFALFALAAYVSAFSSVSMPANAVNQRAFGGQSRLSMAAEEDGANLKSVKKQIVYDEKSGRFFESNKDEADCIPDEEFCVVDKESGAMIRLTVEEKERIFLDSLQVSNIPGPESFVLYPVLAREYEVISIC